MARLTNKFKYPDYKVKLEKIRNKTYAEDGVCIFCKIAEGLEEIIYQDELIIMFRDLKENAQGHFLVIPRRHIDDVNSLNLDDLELVNRMFEIGLQMLNNMYQGQRFLFGYHHAPRNSIGHLHMHCIVLPFKKWKSKFSYSSCLWFITPQELIKKIMHENPIYSMS